MKVWDINKKPSLDECPMHFCFCWTPPKGAADLSGRQYDSFKDAVTSDSRVTILHGGCAYPLGKCIRETGCDSDGDHYEPHNSVLKKQGLPELFFCNPKELSDSDMLDYRKMASEIWSDK